MCHKVLDIESSGLDPIKDALASVQFGTPGNILYSDISMGCFNTNVAEIIDYLVDPAKKVIIQNAVFEWEWFYVKFGIEITNFEDTMLLSFILDKGVPFQYTGNARIDNPRKLKSVGLKAMGEHYLGIDCWEDSLVEKLGTKKKSPGIVRLVNALFFNKDKPLSEIFKGKGKVLTELGIEDNETGRAQLYEIFTSYAKKDINLTDGIWNLVKHEANNRAYRKQLEAIPYLIKMKHRGIKIDRNRLVDLQTRKISEEVHFMEKIIETVGEEFDLNSPEQLAKVLKKRGLRLPQTDKGNDSTSKTVLKEVDDPLVKMIIAYREAGKMRSTYIDGLLAEMDENNLVHPRYNMCGTIHGRYSSR